MERTAIIEVVSALVKESSECLLLADEGQCVATSRPAAALLSGNAGSINVLLETLVPMSAQPKLKAAWTRADKKSVTSATIDPTLSSGPTQLQFHRFAAGLHLLRIKPTSSDPQTTNIIGTQLPETLAQSETEAFQKSNPDLPESFRRQALISAIEKASSDLDHTGQPYAILTIDVISFRRLENYWQSGDACRIVLRRLNDVVRGHDTIVHLGGPRFGVLQLGVNSQEDVDRLRNRIVTTLHEPFIDEPMPPHVKATTDARLIDNTDQTQEELMCFLNQAAGSASDAQSQSTKELLEIDG